MTQKEKFSIISNYLGDWRNESDGLYLKMVKSLGEYRPTKEDYKYMGDVNRANAEAGNSTRYQVLY